MYVFVYKVKINFIYKKKTLRNLSCWDRMTRTGFHAAVNSCHVACSSIIILTVAASVWVRRSDKAAVWTAEELFVVRHK